MHRYKHLTTLTEAENTELKPFLKSLQDLAVYGLSQFESNCSVNASEVW